MGNIDIREIRMGKWHVPKSSDIFGSGDGNDFFLAMGYFDMLEVKATKTKEGEGPSFSLCEHHLVCYCQWQT